jgi:YjjW family glycine radical enzyme activase
MDEALLTRSALVSRVLPFSCVDGPGNRLVLFLQGATSAAPAATIPTIGLCDDCGDCLAVCPSGALTMSEGKVHWQEALCTDCDACLEACPRQCQPKTRQMSVAEVLALLRRYGPLLTGVTVSGGEATTQLPFVIALFTAIKAAPDLARLTCLLDSNGSLGETGWQRLLPVLDGAMIDLKGWREPVHLALTGRGRERVLASLQLLAQAGKLAEVRLLLVPGRSDFLDATGALEEALTTFAVAGARAHPPQRLSPPRGARGGAVMARSRVG